MTNKLRQYFPMIHTRQEVLAEIEAKPKLKQEFYSWEKKYRKEFLDFCTGVKGVKIMYDFISKEILNPETVPEFAPQAKLFNVLMERSEWADMLGVDTVASLNKHIISGDIN